MLQQDKNTCYHITEVLQLSCRSLALHYGMVQQALVTTDCTR